MKLLEDRILADGIVKPGNILKVDSFLNHQLDPALLYEMAQELSRLYANDGITKVLTIEASGIALAVLTAHALGCKTVFAKKKQSRNMADDVYSVEVDSYTHGNTNLVVLSKEYLHAQDRVLIVDDFLASGAALNGLLAICHQAGATVVGAGIAIEKAFQGGGDALRSKGLRIASLAKIASMSDTSLEFVKD